ncbi:hypothetical protein BH10CYA1_BH10CYA1_65090 [soil metagenome]
MTKRFNILVLVTLIICALVCTSVQANDAGSPKEYWQIEYSTSFIGIVKLKFNDQALWMQFEKLGLTVVATAPIWTSFVYNESNKRYMKLSRDQWKNSKFLEGLMKHRKRSPELGKTEHTHMKKVIGGLHASQILVRSKNQNGALETSSEIWLTSEVNVPTQFKQFLRMALGISENFSGTPLQILVAPRDLATKQPHLTQALAAYKVVRVPLVVDPFKKLSGYKEVANELSLMIDDDAEGVSF